MWATRRVTREDKDAWVDLCRTAEGPDDYVLTFLDHFLERATTYAAMDGERIIGTMTYTDLVDGAGWLSAARTLPEYRGKGVASDLVRALEGLAVSRGRHALRLWTAASNAAGIATFRKNGLREVARFTRMQAEPSPKAAVSRYLPFGADADLMIALEGSDLLSLSNGYVSYDYGFVRVDRGLLRYLQGVGALMGWGGQVAIVSGASEGYVEEALEVEPLAGDLAALLAEARVHARAGDKARVETFLPHDPMILETARNVGFTHMAWGQEAILCEKPLV
jgi:ribosomal protein S18 acetylase RimI-like enzyme